MPATATPPSYTGASDEDALDYRSVHTFAVLGLLLGLFSAVMVFSAGSGFETTLMLAPIPVVALIFSLLSLQAIATSPDLYTGAPLARAGAALSLLFLVGGVGYSGYVYATEVPEGYARTSFIAMKPSESDIVDRKLIPDDVRKLLENKEPVFIKGYIRPDSIKFQKNLKAFLLVRDNQQCCFGDLSKVQYFDQIQVNLATGLTTDYHSGLFRLGGKLKIAPGDPQLGSPLTYQLDADFVKP